MPRLFVALTIPPDVAGTLAALVPPELPGVRRIAPELLHVTLAFLGATPEERVPAVVDAAGAAARGGAPFRIGIERVGRFPPGGRVRVVWAETAEGAEAILRLGGRVREELERRRLPYAPKPLRPHVTLARV
ncbi:MAG: RNA 2',3'-cyclic phosphodiesterase, partial [Chloroflexota bacterium]